MMLLALTVLTAGAAERPVAVHGHRGARAVAPENTLPAFEHALAVGVDILELDTVVTKDDRLLVAHDPVLDSAICRWSDARPLAEGTLARDHTLAELKALDCGSLKNPRFPDQTLVPGTPMPTLDEVLEYVAASAHPAAKSVRFNVESKIVPGAPERAASPERFAELLVETFRRHEVVDRAILQSFDHRVLAAAKALEPSLTVSFLNSDDRPDIAAMTTGLKADVYSPHHLWITRPDVDAMHAAGIEVHPWTANTPAEWERLIGMGVDGIITDDPAALIRYLDARGD